MTLPASFPLSSSQIYTEVGSPLNGQGQRVFTMNHPFVLALANKTALPCSFSQLLGKTGRFDGNLTVYQRDQFTYEADFSGQNLYSGALNYMQYGFVSGNVALQFSSAPNSAFTGAFLIINNSTGVSTRVTKFNSTAWTGNNLSANFMRLATDSFTILPSN